MPSNIWSHPVVRWLASNARITHTIKCKRKHSRRTLFQSKIPLCVRVCVCATAQHKWRENKFLFTFFCCKLWSCLFDSVVYMLLSLPELLCTSITLGVYDFNRQFSSIWAFRWQRRQEKGKSNEKKRKFVLNSNCARRWAEQKSARKSWGNSTGDAVCMQCVWITRFTTRAHTFKVHSQNYAVHMA